MPIGGALRYDNDEVWGRLVALAGGKGARFAVFATAAGNPERSAEAIMAALRKHGAEAEHIPVAPRLPGSDYRAAAKDPHWVARVRAARGIYFAGGAQERITQALSPDGQTTPVLEAIREVFRNGGVVAGSSAGAAIMSATMFRDAPDLLAVLGEGVRMGQEIAPGLAFVDEAVMVDQHFLKRGRIGRLLPAMLQQNIRLGIGIDENTAAIFQGDEVEVIGGQGALIIDLHHIAPGARVKPLRVRNVRLTYVDRNDRYNLRTRTLIPSPEKRAGTRIDSTAPGFRTHFEAPRFYPDLLADGVIVGAMAQLVDGPVGEVRGLAFAPQRQPAFEFRLHRAADTLAWFTSARGGEDYSIANAYLDVHPVRMAQPIYSQVAATPPRQ